VKEKEEEARKRERGGNGVPDVFDAITIVSVMLRISRTKANKTV